MLLTAWAFYESLFGKGKINDAKNFFRYREPEKTGRYPPGYKVYPVRPIQYRISPNYIGLFDLPRWIRLAPTPNYVFRTPLQLRKKEEE